MRGSSSFDFRNLYSQDLSLLCIKETAPDCCTDCGDLFTLTPCTKTKAAVVLGIGKHCASFGYARMNQQQSYQEWSPLPDFKSFIKSELQVKGVFKRYVNEG